MRRLLPFILALSAAALLTPALVGAASQQQLGPVRSLCSSGYVSAVIGGQFKCLRAGEFCSAANESDYEHAGFANSSRGGGVQKLCQQRIPRFPGPALAF